MSVKKILSPPGKQFLFDIKALPCGKEAAPLAGALA